MISMKFPRQRVLSFLSSQQFSAPAHHSEKAAHASKSNHDSHDAHSLKQAEHHDDHGSTVEPYQGPINQTRYVKIFPNEESEHFTKSFYNVMGHLTRNRSIFSLFYNNLSAAKNQEVSEYWNPPKIHENSVFIYQSKRLGNSVRVVRGVENLTAAYVLLFCPHPLFYLAAGAAAYGMWLNAFFYEMSRRLVVRMDLLPHLEMINMQRVGAFGRIHNKQVRVKDLEKVKFEELETKENFFWELNNYVVDKQMIFRDKSTGELFCFDKKGVWNEEGLNHKLIN